MEHARMTQSQLKEKSRELNMSFSSLLAEYVLEELMYQISKSPYLYYLWLQDDRIFQTGKTGKSILVMDFVYLVDPKISEKEKVCPGQQLSLKLLYMMLLSFIGQDRDNTVKWSGKADYNKASATLEVIGEMDDMQVPIHIHMSQKTADSSWMPVKKVHRMLVDQNEQIVYFGYPVELLLSEQLFCVLKNMELTADMDVYFCIYETLSSCIINGRHVREELSVLCKNGNIPFRQERVEELLSYRDYTYMRKKWDKYLRRSGKTEPSWENVVDKFGQFLPVIWQAVCRDDLFFGDWMPDLGRFLD